MSDLQNQMKQAVADAAVQQIKDGIAIVGDMQVKQIEEYFHRLRRAGFEERIPRSKFQPLLADLGISGQTAEVPA